MKSMGIRELKAHMSEAIREVQEGKTIEIRHRGEAVALLAPVHRRPDEAEVRAALASLDSLAAEIGSYARQPTDVARAISNMRR